MTTIAIIPARGGSKGIPRKNLAMLNHQPLIAYSIQAAFQAKDIDHVVVSTDAPEIADVSRALGAEVPFMRPPALAADDTPMLSVLLHALDWYEAKGISLETVILLQPTSPFRTGSHIDDVIKLFRLHKPSSVVSVMEVPHSFNPVSVLKIGAFMDIPNSEFILLQTW